MASARPATTIDRGNYQRAGIFALIGALGLTLHALYATFTGGQLAVALAVAPFFLNACVVVLAITILAVRGRNLGIALGMIGSVAGLTSGLSAALGREPGLPFTASIVLAFAGALIVGLSFLKPRSGWPKYAVYAGVSGAVFLVLRGLIGVLDEAYHDLAYLAPALAWAWLGVVCLGPDPLPHRTTAPASTTRARPVGQTKPRPGQARKSKPKKKR